MRKAIEDYDMIQEGDKIAVALSGGKDSVTLLYALKNLQIFYPKKFELMAITVNPGFDGFDTKVLEKIAEEVKVELVIAPSDIKAIVFDVRKEKNPCSLCANLRRGILNSVAKEHGCNKIALGHHMDDIINTAMLNLYFQGSFSTMPVKLKMRKMPLTIIRPLALEAEMDLQKYAKQRGYARQLKVCPYNDCSKRTVVKKLFEEIATTHPEARYSVWHALENSGKLVEE